MAWRVHLGCVWSPLLEPGMALLSGARRDLRGFAQELTHHAVHARPDSVLWCDGDHGFDPYDFAELNLTRGHAADDGAERVLVKRCMTPFQWDSVLTQHLDQKLLQAEASLVIVLPYDRLFSTDEMQDWEQEDHVRFSLEHLKATARRHRVPILLGADMAAWWRTHPVLAGAAYAAADARWSVAWTGGRWRAVPEKGEALDPWLATPRSQSTLLDFVPDPLLATAR